MRLLLVAALWVGCTERPEPIRPEPVRPEPPSRNNAFAVFHPYPDTGHVVVVLGERIEPPRAPAKLVPLGPPGTDRCDGPEHRTMAELPDDGVPISVTLLAKGATCVVQGVDLVAIQGMGWQRGVSAPSGACGEAEWALPGVHPAATLVLTEKTRFYGKVEAAALPPDEGALLRTPEPASILVLKDERLPYDVYELWRSTGPQDGVRLRRNGALVRALPDRPRAYVIEGARVGAILWGVGRFSVVDI